MQRVLIIGGTHEAVQLAARLAQLPGIEVISSLAGRTRQPTVPTGTMRVGGFGGVAGLRDYLRAQGIALLLDATHPFAAQISWQAAEAAQDCGVPHLQLVRPAWEPTADDHWIVVDTLAAAAAHLPGLATRVFLSIGRQELATFAHLTALWCLMRMIEPPLPEAPRPPGLILLERGPWTLEAERRVLQTYAIEALVSKNSGGGATYAKIQAARELGLPVVLVQRPPAPDGEQVATVEQACLWVQHVLG